MNVICIDPARVREFWPHVKHLVRRAMTRMKLSEFAHVEHNVLSGMALLWIAHDDRRLLAAAVTQLELVDGEKYCTVVAYGGKGFRNWSQAIQRLEEFGKAEGCKAMRIFGRRGWSRALPAYKTHALVLQKELS